VLKVADPCPDDDPPLPSYRDPGWIMFEITHYRGVFGYDVDVIAHDSQSSVMWIEEGMGIDYWVSEYVDLEQPGTYIITGITGRYIKGDMYTTDDDEDWDFELCRYASKKEIEAQAPA
jgi:hypothetical protein